MNVALDKISFAIIQRYLANRNWKNVESKREFLSIWRLEKPTPIEILLPHDRHFIDYSELIIKAFNKISLSENRDVEQIINDLLLPPSDVIRFRVNNKRTEKGLITFNEGLALLENAKKSLFTAACDILQPSLFHKRLSNNSAQQFIDSCYLGQTERGSFVASVVCPFVNTTVDEKPTQLSLYDSDEDLQNSFTRKVTKRYMESLSTIKKAIETGKHEMIEKLNNSNEVISANFIESILDMGEYSDNDEIEIIASWSSITKEVTGVQNVISFTRDYTSPMESIVARLKPKDEGVDGVFVGKISKAQADPDPTNRTEGKITFNFIGNEDKIIRANVLLTPEDFSKACEALDKGLYVQISGKLIQSGKTKTIANPNFEMLTNALCL